MEREKLIEYIEKGFGILRIARAEGVSASTIRHWLKRHGLKTRSNFHDPRPRNSCRTCDNVVDTLYNKYCAICIERRVYNRKTDGLELEELKTDRSRKARILKERGHRCENCGLTEWQGLTIKLELHHVDGDADNNSRENLQLLCLNCHALTPTFRGKNRANGVSRRKIYRKNYYES
jgi:hypothetical protein